MMIRKILYSILLCFIALSTVAQETESTVSFTKGAEYFSKAVFRKTIMQEDGNYYCYFEPLAGSKSILMVYDSKLNRIRQVKYDGRKKYFEDFLSFGENLYSINARYKKSKAIMSVFLQKIDKRTQTITGTPDTLGTATLDTNNLWFKHDWGYTFSPDKKLMLVYFPEANPHDTTKRIKLNILNTQMKILSSNIVKLHYSNIKIVPREIKMDNERNTYLSAQYCMNYKRFKQRPFPYTDKLEYKNIIFKINKSGKVLKHIVTVEGYRVSDIKINFNQEGDVYCAGYYTDPNDQMTIKIGYFSLCLDGQNFNIKHFIKDKFTYEYICRNQLEMFKKPIIKRAEAGKEIGIENLSLDNIILKKDGGLFIIGQQSYQSVTGQNSNNESSMGIQSMSSGNTNIYYGPITILNIGKDGSLIWAKKIARHKSSRNQIGGFSSYAIHSDTKYLYFLINDAEENLDLKDDNNEIALHTEKSHNQILMIVRVDFKGNIERIKIRDNKHRRIKAIPEKSWINNQGEMVFPMQWDKNIAFGKIVFKN